MGEQNGLSDKPEFLGFRVVLNASVPEGSVWLVQNFPPLVIDMMSGKEINITSTGNSTNDHA